MSFDIQKITKIKKDNILDYIVNSLIKNELVYDYYKYKDNPDNCYYKDFWQFLDITSSEIVNKLYERVNNFVNNIKDIDYAELDSIVNLAKQFNLENNLVNFIDNTKFPLEILELINIFSINKSLLLKSDLILTNETLSGLYYNYFYNTTSATINTLSAISPFVSGFTSGFVDTYIPSIQHINIAIPEEKYTKLIELSGNINNAQYIPNNIYIDNNVYYDFIEYVFREVLRKFIYLKYRTEELNIPTGLTGYIFEYIYPEILPTIQIEAQLTPEEQEIVNLLIKNNITYTFDYKTIADKIELGIDSLEHYTLLEQQILNLELAKRNKLVSRQSYSLNKNKRLREVKVKEYFGFVFNFGIIDYNDFFLKYPEYLDKNKFEYIRNNNQDFITITDDNQIILNDNYINNTAKFLRNLCIDISKFREYFKNLLKKELLSLCNKGIKVLIRELFDNYIFDLSAKYYSNMNLHPELSGLYNIPKHPKFSIDIIEYYDANEYFNIKSDYIDYDNDKRFDLDAYKLREKYFNIEENNYLFTDAEISGFYYNQLNLSIPSGLSVLSAFQENIFNSSHLSAFVTSKANSIKYYKNHYLPVININSLEISDKIITGEPDGIFKNNYRTYIINSTLINNDCWYIPPSGILYGSLINTNNDFNNLITNSGEGSGYYIDITQQNIPLTISNSGIEYGNIQKSVKYKQQTYDISGIVDNLLVYKYNTSYDNIYNISGSFSGDLLLTGDIVDFYYDIILSGDNIENLRDTYVSDVINNDIYSFANNIFNFEITNSDYLPEVFVGKMIVSRIEARNKNTNELIYFKFYNNNLTFNENILEVVNNCVGISKDKIDIVIVEQVFDFPETAPYNILDNLIYSNTISFKFIIDNALSGYITGTISGPYIYRDDIREDFIKKDDILNILLPEKNAFYFSGKIYKKQFIVKDDKETYYYDILSNTESIDNQRANILENFEFKNVSIGIVDTEIKSYKLNRINNMVIDEINNLPDNLYYNIDGLLYYYDITEKTFNSFQRKRIEFKNKFLHNNLPIIDINQSLEPEERDYNNFITNDERATLFKVISGFTPKTINNFAVSAFPIKFNFYSTYNLDYSYLYIDNNINIYERYINAEGIGINNPYNYKNSVHPTIATLPNLKRFIEKVVDDITTVFNDILTFAFDYMINDYNKLNRILNNHGSFINSWMKDNIDYTFYQTFYEYSLNLDKYDNENKYIDFNGPWNIDALNAYLTDTNNYIAKLENNTNEYYQHLKDFKPADAKFNANILKLLKLVDDDTNYQGFGLDTIKQLIDKHIYTFGLDSYRNEWFLYKNKNIFEYPGRLFVRIRSHPLALPADLFINNIDHNSFKNIKYILDFKVYGNTLILITDNPISPKILFCKIAMTRADNKSPKRISIYVEPIHGLEYFDYSQIERLYIGCYIYDNKLFLVDAEADRYNNTLPVNPNNPKEYLLKINNRYYDLVDGTISNEISNITIPVKFNIAYGDIFKSHYILADSDIIGDTVYYQLPDNSGFRYYLLNYLLNISGLSENVLESASLIKLSKTKGYLSLSYTSDMKFNRFFNFFNVSGDYYKLHHDKQLLAETMKPLQMPIDGLTIVRLFDDEDTGVLSLDSVYYCRPLSNLKHLPILSRPESDYDNKIADDIDSIKDKLTKGIFMQFFASDYPREFDIIPFGLVKIDNVIYRIYIDFNKYRTFENFGKVKIYNDNFRCTESDISGSYRFNENVDILDSTILIFDDLDSYGRVDSYNNEEKEEKLLNKINKYIINTVRNGLRVYPK